MKAKQEVHQMNSIIPARQNLAQDDDEPRRNIDSQIARLSEAIRVLQRSRNNLSPILNLPANILSMIFMNIVVDADPPDSGVMINISQTCRYLREVAIHCPLLWTRIHLFRLRHPDILSRSKQLPIFLEFYSRNAYRSVSGPVSDLIGANAHRIQGFNLECTMSTARDLLASLNKPAPLLQVANLSVGLTDRSEINIRASTQFLSHTPNLRDLTIELPVDWSLLVFSKLTRLHVKWEVSPRKMLSALGGMPHLQELELRSYVLGIPTLNMDSTIDAVVINLESLRKLNILGGSLRDSSYFINHLRCPPSTIVYMEMLYGAKPEEISKYLSPSFYVSVDQLKIVMDGYALTFIRPLFTFAIRRSHFTKVTVPQCALIAHRVLARCPTIKSLELTLVEDQLFSDLELLTVLEQTVHLDRLKVSIVRESKLPQSASTRVWGDLLTLPARQNLAQNEPQRNIDSKITRLSEAIRVLQRSRNTLSPISKLPAEILSAIFMNIVVGADPPDSGVMVNISRTCRYWREVAIHCPLLWTRIHLFRRIHPDILSRSKQLPIFLEFSDRDRYRPVTGFVSDFIGANAHRIQGFNLKCITSMARDLLASLNKPAPLLQVASISVQSTELIQTDTHASTQFLSRTPNLRNLTIGLPVDWSLPVFSKLTRLHVEWGGNPRGMLSALGGMPRLQELGLKMCILNISSLDVSNSVDEVVINLKSLRKLNIWDRSLRNSSRFISQLRYPPSTLVHLEMLSGAKPEEIPMYLPPSFCVSADRLQIFMDGPGLTFIRPLFTFAIERSQFINVTVPQCALVAHQVLARCPTLKSLELTLAEDHSFSELGWLTVLEQTAHLDRLAVSIVESK